jgi:hypothetical protein
MTLSQVINLNNVAVSMMKAANYNNAVERLTEAIRVYQRLEYAFCRNSKNGCPQESTINASMINGLKRQNDLMEVDSNDHFMYRQGSIIPANPNPLYIPPIIIFNLALTRHLQATQVHIKEECRQQIMTKSSQLYEIAFHRYLEVGGSRCGLLAITATNNNALIYNEFGDRDNAQRCLELLHSAVAQLMRFGDRELLHYAYDFLRNILSLGGIQDIQAGAAAAA